MRLATIRIKCEDIWIGKFADSSGMDVKVQRCVLKSGGRGKSLLRIEGPEGTSQKELDSRMGGLPSGCSLTLTAVSPGKWVGTAEVSDCRLCCALSNSDCMLESARSLGEREVEWVLVSPNAEALTALVKDLESQGCTVKMERVSQLKDSRELTGHQRRALRMAFELGYYEIPKRITLDKLAKIMEISKPTLDIMLRRAQRKLVEDQMAEL